MRTINFEQGTPEWKQARAGKITGSRIADVLNVLKKGGESANRVNYRMELAAERLTGMPTPEGFVSRAMQQGTEREPQARAAYEMTRDGMVDQVGFVLHPVFDFAGASPDGIVVCPKRGLGGVEIKCPLPTTHLKYFLGGVVPEEYEPQMVWEMACCDLQWMDFISFCPDYPEGLDLFVVTMQRNQERIEAVEQEVLAFNLSIDNVANQVKQRITPQEVGA